LEDFAGAEVDEFQKRIFRTGSLSHSSTI
jgi:hypothetical protein